MKTFSKDRFDISCKSRPTGRQINRKETKMDWAKGYLLITLAAFLCEYIRLRVDYHILEIAIMITVAPLAIFAICVLFYFVLAALTDHVCDFIENGRSRG